MNPLDVYGKIVGGYDSYIGMLPWQVESSNYSSLYSVSFHLNISRLQFYSMDQNSTTKDVGERLLVTNTL